ncbi:MAG: hypothetical protein ACTHU0_00430 [Kofleriaceae bacterium]
MLAACACLLAGSSQLAHADDETPPLSVYGFARLDLLVNDSRMSAVDDPTFVLREPAAGQIDSELTMTPRLSRVGLSIEDWNIHRSVFRGEGKLEIDFAGGAGLNAIRLRHAYASIYVGDQRRIELLAGQTWDLVSPLFPTVQNDTQLRHAGNLGDRRAQARLSMRPLRHLLMAVAAAAPAVLDPQDRDGDGRVDGMASGAPMLQFLVEMSGPMLRQQARLGVSGHVGRTELASGERTASHSVAAHVYLPFGRFAALHGEGYIGSNLAELGGGIGQGVNAATGKAIQGLGGWIELAMMPSSRHLLAVGASADVARAEDLEIGDRERNRTIYQALRYKPKQAIQLGLEYLYWRTAYHGMTGGTANRVDAHVSVFF